MYEENKEIQIVALKEMERIFVSLKGDFIKAPERSLFQAIQDKISHRIVEIENELIDKES